MTIRTALALAAAPLALVPALAQGQATLSYETGQYEYAQPLPELDNDVVTETVATTAPETVVFVEGPVVQPIPGENAAVGAPPLPAARTIPARADATPVSHSVPQMVGTGQPQVLAQPGPVYVQAQPPVLYAYPASAPLYAAPAYGYAPGYAYAPQPNAGAARVIYRDDRAMAPQPVQAVPYGYGYQPAQVSPQLYLPAGAQVVAFDRSAWLQECRARLDTYDSDSDRGEVIGALVGGVAGGLIGNRIAGRGNRTAGTLIGAGAGALAGMAAGDAIEDRSRRDRGSSSADQCSAYLDDYMQQAQANAGQVAYNQPGAYMLVPVTVAMPQTAVYRDGTPAN